MAFQFEQLYEFWACCIDAFIDILSLLLYNLLLEVLLEQMTFGLAPSGFSALLVAAGMVDYPREV